MAGLGIEGARVLLGEPARNGWETLLKLGMTSARMEVFCDNPDAFISRALEAGAKGSIDIPENHQRRWGVHRRGGFTDRFGHIWPVGDKSPLKRFP